MTEQEINDFLQRLNDIRALEQHERTNSRIELLNMEHGDPRERIVRNLLATATATLEPLVERARTRTELNTDQHNRDTIDRLHHQIQEYGDLLRTL